MEILPVTSQFNVGFSSEKGESTFYSFASEKLVREVDFLTGSAVLLCGARSPECTGYLLPG